MAKNFLLEHCKPLSSQKAYYAEGEDSFENYNINIQLKTFIKRLLNAKRFQTISTVILDFDIPDMNGLDLARALKSLLPLKIIMLTGVADLNTAINALNHKEIDQFVLKSDPNHAAILREYIQQLQQDYFTEFYQGVADALNKNGKHPLCDPDFIALFQDICQQYQIVEYYLLSESGSFLMLDVQGNQTYLIVNTEADLKSYLDLAQDDENAPPNVCLWLQDRSQVVFVPDIDDFLPYVKDWKLFDAYKVKGKQIYYAIVQEPLKPEFIKRKIFNYRQFLQQAT